MRQWIVGTVVLGLAVATARADMILWNSGVSGNWSIAANWDVNDVPDAGDDAVISVAGAYTVDLDANVSVDSLDISNADTTFETNSNALTLLAAGLSNAGTITVNGSAAIDGAVSNAGAINVDASRTLTLMGPMVTNDGTILVNPTGGNATTLLNIDGNVVIDGAGALVLNQTTSRARLDTTTDSTITNAAGHTISGTGQILATLNNQGAVVSDRAGLPLELVTNDKSNTGTMTATNSSFLDITGVTVDQTASTLGDDAGQIIADGGTVRLENGATIEGGSLSTPDGAIVNSSATNTLSNVTNTGTVNINAATSLIAGGASLVNDGTIVINSNQANAATSISFDPNLVLDGSGDIQMNHTNTLAQLTGGPFTQMPSHTIHGRGEIHAAMTNNGTITADVNNLALELLSQNKINHGLMTTSGGGILQIGGITVSQNASTIISQDAGAVDGQIVADDGLVQLVGNGDISGGTISTANGGLVQNSSGVNSLTDLTNQGSVQVIGGTTLNAAGTALTNNGTVVVNSNQSNATTVLAMDADIALNGTGDVLLNFSTSRARITGGPMTNSADHTIHGTGQILAPMDNLGAVTADRSGNTLELLNGDTLNLGTLLATNTGTLSISNTTVTQFEGTEGVEGQIVADGGKVSLGLGATIVDGSLNTPNGSEIAVDSVNPLLTDVTNNGLVNVLGAQTLSADGSAFTNNGTVVVNSNQINATTTFALGANTPLAGTGDVLLNFSTSRARITGGPTSNGADHTIHGTGQILAPMDNLGAIVADRSGNTLELLNGDMLNLGTLTATNSGTLSIGSVTITQADGGGLRGSEGQIVADGGTVSLASGATIVDGSLNTPNGSQITVNANNILLTDVTNNGLVNVLGGQTLSADGSALTNNGTIVVNSSQANAVTNLNMGTDTALDGAGELVLNFSSTRAQLTGGPTSNGADHTIRGTGQILAPMENFGLVTADRDGAVLELANTTTLNLGTMSATNNSTLSIGAVVVTQENGTEGLEGQIIADGGKVSLVAGASIVGGSIDTPNGGQTAVDNNVGHLADVTNNGLLNVLGGQGLSIEGSSVANNGTIVVNSNAINATTDLTMAANTAFTGAGSVVLNNSSTRARILGGPASNGLGHTIHGAGQVVAELVNEGVVNADRSGLELEVMGGAKTNNNTMMASNGGVLNVQVNVDGTGGWTADGGQIHFNTGVQATTTGPIVIINGGSVVLTGADVSGSDLMMDDSGVLSVGSSIALTGNVSYAMTDEANWSWASDAVLTLTGGDAAGCLNEWTTYEVGGDAAAGGAGFALATLEVADGAAVSLIDTLDNGNRGGGGESEALLVGELALGMGAKLNLNGHRLFLDGVEQFAGPFGDGDIVDTVGNMGDLNGDGMFNIADRNCFTNCYTGPGIAVPPGCEGADIDGDGDADCDDWALLRQLTGGGNRPLFGPCAFDAGPGLLSSAKAEPQATTAAPACGAGVGAAGFVSLSLLAVGFAGTNRRRR